MDSSRRATANSGTAAGGSDGAVGEVAAMGFTVSLAAMVVLAAVSAVVWVSCDVLESVCAPWTLTPAAGAVVVSRLARWVIRCGPDLMAEFVVLGCSRAEFDDAAADTDPVGLESADDGHCGAQTGRDSAGAQPQDRTRNTGSAVAAT